MGGADLGAGRGNQGLLDPLGLMAIRPVKTTSGGREIVTRSDIEAAVARLVDVDELQLLLLGVRYVASRARAEHDS